MSERVKIGRLAPTEIDSKMRMTICDMLSSAVNLTSTSQTDPKSNEHYLQK